MRFLAVLGILALVSACDPNGVSGYSAAPKTTTQKSGITVSGSARVGVVYRPN